ncbi:unnamed protein product [Malassezia sympodialis ATCC 42132]|uniref:uncharacterized protein n=1 Tax=Malassezia sympodialis (strain ATCC 42132) TaxID=1230383 RepID=UPI0002C2412F|nr:uncharacterized protein MSY001_2080 [Malassezia sympodialis ATCC 42132]CCU99374.1 unnamed protein product [Malassezia sympodialis ATCC 42132]|eukprot:XP_018740627.1 uncharacterized protein MSY001_2080 [Malassezia sympodialis ATCC 42132]
MANLSAVPRYIEIAVNLGDPMFQGEYHGKKKHEGSYAGDLEHVIRRAEQAGVSAQVITAGALTELPSVLQLTDMRSSFFCTAGCHPTHSSDMETYEGGPEAFVSRLQQYIQEHDRIVATYADYDRLHFASAETQKRCFDLQLQMATKVRLPLFLHSRAAHKDFVDILRPYLNSLRPPEIQTDKSSPGSVGVVHSFTGTAEELHELLDLGLYIGVNGCSLKTQENLDVVKRIPLHRILLETGMCSLTNGRRPVYLDEFKAKERELAAVYSPPRAKPEKWSPMTAVKGRCEPCQIGEVAAVVARIQGVSLATLAAHAYQNAVALFRLPVL